ncbi:c-type cytochrome [Sphingomonas oligophenolica]|uniref:Cytochrome c n=1 Tax=Sphingomonas oligophenolica TaxID=301154 RepID=A0A502CHU8_9SPHN|nr:cytochrome c [Sphingomonas oligophenolica]TPG12757.1 cytochrome c [Sphingomonas oligophenolica]
MTNDFFRRHFPSLGFVAVAIALVILVSAIAVQVGAYDVAADAPHTAPVHALLERVRDRSITVRARAITVPADLASPARLDRGAGLYAEMCTGCHLGPGLERSELSQGLYPQAPELAKSQDMNPAQQFWIIKHGVKLTAMPAWGRTHPDPLIWDMVAFLRRLPTMTPAQYQAAIASAPADHDEMMGEAAHGHGADHHH